MSKIESALEKAVALRKELEDMLGELPPTKSKCPDCDQTALTILDWIEKIKDISKHVSMHYILRRDLELITQEMYESASLYLDLDTERECNHEEEENQERSRPAPVLPSGQ